MTTRASRLAVLVLAALVAAVAILALGAGPAPADDDKGERAISRYSGNGLKACRVAARRVGGGTCLRVVEDRDDRERYEVKVRRGTFRFEIDLSRTFRILDVDRERIGSDDD